jgi:fucose permease
MNLLQPTVVLGLLAAGMGAALIGSIKVSLAERLGIDESRVGGLVSTFGLIMIPVVLMMGVLVDLLGRPAVLVSGSVLIACALVVLARSKSYIQALIGVVLLSAGWAASINVLNVLLPTAFTGSHVYATNLGNTFFGLGAFLTPLVIVFLLRRTGFSPCLMTMAIFALLFGMLALGASYPIVAKQTAALTDGTSAVSFWANRPMWLCSLALFFYLPLEATMAAWFTTYLGDNGVKANAAPAFLSAFWLAFMISRLVVAFDVLRLPEGSETMLVLACALAGTVVLTGVVVGHGPRLAAILVVLAGFVFGPVFPTLMAVLLKHCEPSVQGRAVGLFFALGGIGWSTLPVLIGIYARRSSVQRAFLIAVGAAVGLVATALILPGSPL